MSQKRGVIPTDGIVPASAQPTTDELLEALRRTRAALDAVRRELDDVHNRLQAGGL